MTLYALGDQRPTLPDDGDFWVADDANVIGDVTLGSGASVWFGSTLRGDNEPIVIGRGTNVQENCVVHTDPGFPCTVGDGVVVGHKVMLHGCVIGDGTLIGMGATVLNGAVIGKNCVIGAGALVTEGKEIPDGSLVMGMPAKVIRQVEPRHLEVTRRGAENYEEKQRRYRRELRMIDET